METTQDIKVGLLSEFISWSDPISLLNLLESKFNAEFPAVQLNLTALQASAAIIDDFNVLEIKFNDLGQLFKTGKIQNWNDAGIDFSEYAEATKDINSKNILGIPHVLEGLYYITTSKDLANATSIADLTTKLTSVPTPYSKAKLASFELNQPVDMIRLLQIAQHQSPGIAVTSNDLIKLLDLCQTYGRSRCIDTDISDKTTIMRELATGKILGIVGSSRTLSELEAAYPDQTFYLSNLPLGANSGQLLTTSIFVKNANCTGNCTQAAINFINFINSKLVFELLITSTIPPLYLMPSTKSAYQIESLQNNRNFALLQQNSLIANNMTTFLNVTSALDHANQIHTVLTDCKHTRAQHLDLDTDLDIYVISLDRTPERYAKVKAQLDHLDLNHQKFSAIDGYDIKFIDTITNITYTGRNLKEKNFIIKDIPYQVICPGNESQETLFYAHKDRAATRRYLSPGEFGIYCSSRALWKKIASQEHDRPALILEDDIQFLPPYNNNKADIQKIFEKTPPYWEMIYLVKKHYEEKIVLTPWGEIRQEEISNCSNNAIQKITPTRIGFFAYIINQLTAQKFLLSTVSFNSSIDTHITNYVRKETYITTLPIVDAIIENSTITSMAPTLVDLETKHASIGETANIALSVEPVFTTDIFSKHIKAWNLHKYYYRARQNLRCLEIGSHEGQASLYIMQNYCNAPTARLDCIGGWNKNLDSLIFERFLNNTVDYRQAGLLVPIEDEVTSALTRLNQEVESGIRKNYDCIYLDPEGNSPNMLTNIVKTWKILDKTGIMFFNRDNSGLKAAIDSFLQIHKSEYSLLNSPLTQILKTK